MSGRPRVLFAPAGSAEIGGGHLMRDLALAEALQDRGARCSFATSVWGERLLQRFADPRPAVHPLARPGDIGAIAAVVQAVAPDVLVVDDYGLGEAETARLMGKGLKIVVVDDLADRRYACDLLVDPGFGRTPADYAGRTSQGCELLLGPRYALLRAPFAGLAALPSPPSSGPVRRVFVSFGLSDIGGVAARAVEALRPLAPGAQFDVALASDAQSLDRLRALAAEDAGLIVHPDSREVAALMHQADIAIGAGGSATWERCALGLPSLAVVVADNQRTMIARLAEAGALLATELRDPGFAPRLCKAFVELCDPGVRLALSDAGRAICDGRGAGRVAEAILALCAS